MMTRMTTERGVADQLLTVREAAARIRLHPRNVQRRVASGEIPWVNIAPADARRPTVRIRESALAEYLERRDRAGLRAS
jgi:excisionase family DNA binding protein